MRWGRRRGGGAGTWDQEARTRLTPPLGRSSPRPHEGKQRLGDGQLPSDCHIADTRRWTRRRFESPTAAVGTARPETSELSQATARGLINKWTRTERRHEGGALHRPGEGKVPEAAELRTADGVAPSLEPRKASVG